MVLYRDKTSYTKLLHTKPRTGLALYKSLANHVWDFVLKIKYELLQTKPHTEANLRRSSFAKVRGFALLITQTLMKRTSTCFVLLLLLVPSLSFADFDVSLKYGSKGDAVIELQDFLQDQGFLTGKIDGKFGLGTLRAVKAWQTSVNLFSDGYFGLGSRTKANGVLTSLLKDSNNTEQAETGAVNSPTIQINPAQAQIDELNHKLAELNQRLDGQTQSQVQVSTPSITPNISSPQSIPSVAVQPLSPNLSLIKERNERILVVQRKIDDLREQYQIDLQNIDKTAGFLAQANGLKQKLTQETNIKLQNFNSEITALYNEYNNKIGQPSGYIPNPVPAGAASATGYAFPVGQASS